MISNRLSPHLLRVKAWILPLSQMSLHMRSECMTSCRTDRAAQKKRLMDMGRMRVSLSTYLRCESFVSIGNGMLVRVTACEYSLNPPTGERTCGHAHCFFEILVAALGLFTVLSASWHRAIRRESLVRQHLSICLAVQVGCLAALSSSSDSGKPLPIALEGTWRDVRILEMIR